MRVETFPQADIAALQALRALLDATAIGGVAVELASLNAPSGAARVSHNQNRAPHNRKSWTIRGGQPTQS
jgi:hypothetical protein